MKPPSCCPQGFCLFTIMLSTRLLFNHSTLPLAQINPILERVSQPVMAVSLPLLSGIEVGRQISTKTNDVITQFLPCIKLLINCQQELRQGLQLTQNLGQHCHNAVAGGQLRAGNWTMTPCKFHNTYVTPTPVDLSIRTSA
jgi:hypothetical protein